jgi:hypothetical protein
VESPTSSGSSSNPSRLGQEIDTITLEIKECVEFQKQISKNHSDIWRAEINRLAALIERRYLLMDQIWLVQNISQEITNIYKENNILVWRLVTDFLPSRFKNTKQVNSSITPAELLEDCSNLDTHSTDRNLVSDFFHIFRRKAHEFEERAKAEHIALESNANKKVRDPVNIDRPKPRGGLIYDALIEDSEDTLGVADRVFEFPDQVLDMEKEIAESIRVANSWKKPILDLKYSKGQLDWFDVERKRDIFGKHGAAVMSFSVTNLCAHCSDENTNEWVRMEPVHGEKFDSYECLQCHYKIDAVCPSCNVQMRKIDKPVVGWYCSNCDGNTPITRDLTREQVGDKSSILIDEVEKLLKQMPIYIKFQEWFRHWVEPYIAGRKTRLHARLSNEA